MPDYKKKKHNKIFSAPKPRKQKMSGRKENENIKMSPAENYRKTTVNQNMKVVKGKKYEQKRRFRAFAGIVAILLVVFGVFELALPMGVFESISHTASLLGTGSYPIELDSTQTINTVNHGSHYYVLTNSQLFGFSASGKKLFSYAHGLENPILKTADTRALLFEQNSNKAYVFTASGLKNTIETEKSIITANISDSGNYALVLHSDKYASAVSVFNKQGKKLYEWFSAENIVNNVAVSPSGKKIAVSAFNATGGKYKSVVSVLNFKSATPEYTQAFENSLIYNLDASHRSSFAVVSEHSIEFIKWSKFKKKQYSNEYSVSMFRPEKSGYVAVFSRKSDKTDNHLVVFSKSGELKYEFNYKGIISDITLSGGHIYCMGETELYLLSDDGKILRQASCGFGAVRISVTSTNTVAVITDNKIEKIKLEQENDK